MNARARLYPTPARRMLLDSVAAGSIRHEDGQDFKFPRPGESGIVLRTTATLADLARENWVALPTDDQTWRLTGLGWGISQLRIMEEGLRNARFVAEIGPDNAPNLIGETKPAPGIRGRWLVTVGTAQTLTTRSAAVAELWHMAALVVAEMPTPFDPGTGPMPGYVAGWCGHRVAEQEWRAGFRVCERCPRVELTAGAR